MERMADDARAGGWVEEEEKEEKEAKRVVSRCV